VVGDTVLMRSDTLGERHEKMQGFSIALGIDEPEEAERVFAALAAGGTVTITIQETFWAHRFGTPWMINYETPT
jgi:PhnB protein